MICRKSDLELELQFVDNQKMFLSSQISGQFNNQSKFDPSSPDAKRIDAIIKNLQQVEKVLEMRTKQIDKGREAVVKEMESIDKVIDKNIETSFGQLGK